MSIVSHMTLGEDHVIMIAMSYSLQWIIRFAHVTCSLTNSLTHSFSSSHSVQTISIVKSEKWLNRSPTYTYQLGV